MCRDDYTRRNGGYDWASGMSNRAVQAYEYGAMPKSRWTKQAILSAIIENNGNSIQEKDLEKLRKGLAGHSVAWLRSNLLSYDSWHHTSSAFNRTDFWSIKDYTVEECLDILAREEVREEKQTSAFRMVLATFSVSVKARRGWSYEEVTRYGMSDGKWFYPLEGYMWYTEKKKVGGLHYREAKAERIAIVREWKKIHGDSIKGLKAYLDKFGL